MALAACLLLTLINVSMGEAQYSGDPKETYSLTTVLTSQPILTAFAAALANSSLLNLAAKGNCTSKNSQDHSEYMQGLKLASQVLAPSEKASTTFASQESADELEAIVSYSTLQSVYTPVDFERGLQFYPTYLTNPDYANVTGSQRVGAYVTDGDIVFESGLKTKSRLVTANIPYAGSDLNGVIHIVDRVLQIPLDAAKIGEIVEISGVVPVALQYPSNPELIGFYGPVPDWTAFAPNSSAGAPSNLDQSSIFDNEAYHFIQGSVFYSPDLQNGTQIKTLEGHNLTITVAPNGTKYVNDVAIIGFGLPHFHRRVSRHRPHNQSQPHRRKACTHYQHNSKHDEP